MKIFTKFTDLMTWVKQTIESDWKITAIAAILSILVLAKKAWTKKTSVRDSILKGNFATIHTHTTGLPDKEPNHEILSIAIWKPGMTEAKEWFLNPQGRVSTARASVINEIAPKQVSNAPNIKEVLPEITKELKDCLLISHGAYDFTYLILKQVILRHNPWYKKMFGSIPRCFRKENFVDSHWVARRFYLESDHYGWLAFAEMSGISNLPKRKIKVSSKKIVEILGATMKSDKVQEKIRKMSKEDMQRFLICNPELEK